MAGRTIQFDADEREAAAIDELMAEQGFSEQAVLRQALRLYQTVTRRLKEGEQMSFSGDEQRARDFAGPAAGS